MIDTPSSGVEAFIGLGSNLDEPIQQIEKARLAIVAVPHVAELAFSPLYRSRPVGPQDQPDYINAVMRIQTCLSPLQLLQQLQAIENDQGRVRLVRWGARTLDLDILLYGEAVIDTPTLTIPHREMARRSFVLYPLSDVADQNLLIPGLGPLSQLVANCPADGLQRLVA